MNRFCVSESALKQNDTDFVRGVSCEAEVTVRPNPGWGELCFVKKVIIESNEDAPAISFSH